MAKKIKIKKDDTVLILAGTSKGSKGKVVKVMPDNYRAIVEGVNMVSKHTKPSAQSPQGGIVKKEASLNVSNLALLEDGNVTKVGYRLEDGKKIRFSKKSDKAI